MRRRAIHLLLIIIAAGVMFTVPASAADPYEINVVMGITGAGAFVGGPEAVALRAAETVLNQHGGIKGRPIHFVIQDDQSNPQLTVQLTTELIAKHVPIILGPSYTASCFAVLPLVKDGPVQYCFAPSVHPQPGSYTFSVGVSTKDLALSGVRYFRGRGWTKIAELMTTDATGQDGENVIREDLAMPENSGVQIVDVEHYNPSDVSVGAQIARIKASGAQAIITWVIGPAFGTVLRSAAESGLDLPILTDAGNISNAQMSQYVAFLPKQLFFTGFLFLGHDEIGPGPVRNVQTEFLNALHAQGITPDATYSFSWDAALVVVDALRHVGTSASAKQIRDYIEQLHGFPGINGLLDFRDGSQRGLTGNAGLIVRWEPGNKTWIPVSKAGGAPL